MTSLRIDRISAKNPGTSTDRVEASSRWLSLGIVHRCEHDSMLPTNHQAIPLVDTNAYPSLPMETIHHHRRPSMRISELRQGLLIYTDEG
jgi:hypothetical protein